MYWEIPQGSKIDIQGLECCIPPEGYIYNIATKQLEHIGVYSRSDIPEEQYWERIPLPFWYKEVMKAWDKYDRSKKESDEEFYDRVKALGEGLKGSITDLKILRSELRISQKEDFEDNLKRKERITPESISDVLGNTAGKQD